MDIRCVFVSSSLIIIKALSSVLSNIATVFAVPELTSNLAPAVPPTPTLPVKIPLPVISTPVLVVSSFKALLWYSSTAAFALAIIAFSLVFAFINISEPRTNKLPVPVSSI